MPEFEEQVLQWFFKRTKNSASGKLLAKPIMAKLRDEVINDPVAIRKALMRLRDDGQLDFTPNDRGEPISSYIQVNKPEQATPPHIERWSRVLEARNLDSTDVAALMAVADALSDLPESDMGHVLDGLLRLRSDQDGLAGQHTFFVSASYLLGSSKLLSSLPKRALRAFGIDPGRFPSHPLYVVVAGCASPDAVVLVENPAAFERAIGTRAIDRCAFIATFGFGLSNAQEECGRQLAGMVEDRFAHAITLRREGTQCPDARTLLSNPKITFWGDLDPAGIEIYLRLKRAIPRLELSALYKPMVSALEDSRESHPYIKSVGKEQQPSMPRSAIKDGHVASALLRLCSSRGVDQERVSPEDIESLSPLVLEAKDRDA